MVYFINGEMVDAAPGGGRPRQGQMPIDSSNLITAVLAVFLLAFSYLLYRRAGVWAIVLLVIGGAGLAALYYYDINRPAGTQGTMMNLLTKLSVVLTKFWRWP